MGTATVVLLWCAGVRCTRFRQPQRTAPRHQIISCRAPPRSPNKQPASKHHGHSGHKGAGEADQQGPVHPAATGWWRTRHANTSIMHHPPHCTTRCVCAVSLSLFPCLGCSCMRWRPWQGTSRRPTRSSCCSHACKFVCTLSRRRAADLLVSRSPLSHAVSSCLPYCFLVSTQARVQCWPGAVQAAGSPIQKHAGAHGTAQVSCHGCRRFATVAASASLLLCQQRCNLWHLQPDNALA